MLIYYIYNTSDGGIIEPGTIVAGRSAFGVVKKLCMKHLFTYESYIKSVQKNISKMRKVPVILSSHLVLFSTAAINSYEGVWINWVMIKKIDIFGDNMTITFDEKCRLNVKLSEIAYQCNHRKIMQIINYKNSLV